MPYAILRFQKRKAGGVAACERHNERKKEAYKSNPDIDMERSKDNYHLVNPPRYTYITSGTPGFHGLTGGVYKARERIHRAVADARLLANPASRSRVADFDPN